jgi:hypothetical protein
MVALTSVRPCHVCAVTLAVVARKATAAVEVVALKA